MPIRISGVLLILTVFFPAAVLRASTESSPLEVENASESCCETLRPVDDLWMLSTRHLGCPQWHSPDNPDLQVLHYIPNEGWQQSTWEAWQASGSASGTTVVYVHGNRIDWDKAFRRGMAAYRALIRNAPACEPVRFAIWSWPSTQICGAGRDAKVKADRADLECHYFARFLNHFDSESRVSLIGYSFGARIVSGALHLTAGGRLCGHNLPGAGERGGISTRAALLAAAMHNYWWLPGCRHELSLSQVQSMLVLFNPCDPALRWYPRLERRSRPRALGATSCPCPERLGEDAQRLEQRNVSCEIGKTHDAEAYFDSPSIMSQISERLLSHDLSVAP
jgi:hypothetical protein